MSTIVKAAQSVIDDIDKSAPELEATRELLETLEELAKAKAEYFAEEIENGLLGAGEGVDKLKVPIVAIDASGTDTRAYTSASAEHIADAVGDTIKNLLGVIKDSGDWAKIASAALDAASGSLNEIVTGFLGADQGEADEKRGYEVIVDGYELLRIDYRLWRRFITTQAIKKRVELVAAVAYSKGVVDITKLDPNYFRDKFQGMVAQAYGITDPLESIKKCNELFEALGGKLK